MLRAKQADHPTYTMADLLRSIIKRGIAEYQVPSGTQRADAARRTKIRQLVRALRDQTKELDNILAA